MSAVNKLTHTEAGKSHFLPDTASTAPLIDIRLEVHQDLAELEPEWRAFEQEADATAFQTFAWLATWHRHVGQRERVTHVIVIGRDARRNLLFLLPFAISSMGFARQLSWLGSELCDYNAPLLAPGVSASFKLLWERVLQRLRCEAGLQFDIINLEKMPQRVGEQRNPLCWLPVSAHRSGAYLTQLGSDWTTFYKSKRSSSTRARDRNKRRKLSEMGEVRTVTPQGDQEIVRTAELLMQQKARFFERIGIANMFAKPGYAEFYREVATGRSGSQLVHLSRLQVGDVVAAVNLGLIFRDTYYYVLPSFDDRELSRFAPGVAHACTICCVTRLSGDAGFSISR
jgi:CelD/BcsL family acetyltransferase involved in cellulose biosynthesis